MLSVNAYLLDSKRKQALERGPNCVVHCGHPFREENLTTIAICSGKSQLSKHKYDVFVEVIANSPRDSSVAPSPMNKQKSAQIEKLANSVVS